MKARRTVPATLIAIVALAATTGCKRHRTVLADGVLSLSVEQQSAWIRNFNPIGPGEARWPTQAGIYEPLFIFNGMTREWVPWLATDYSWSEDNLMLRFTIRDGVNWSDGTRFTADDVRFTFELLHEHRALDQRSVWSFLRAVETPEPNVVEFVFDRVFVPGLGDIAAQPIVPRHIWSRVDDPVTFANPNPVATGPFTEVNVFRNQVYELGRNPYYWRQGQPYAEALRFLAYPANDQANLALIEGSVDWAGNFVPAVERTFVQRDPEHNAYWFPAFGSMVFLYLNTAVPPFDDARVRKALSMAINRERLVEVAMYNYTSPAHPVALSDAYEDWRIDVPEASNWTRFDIDEANRVLDEAGCRRGRDGIRRTPAGDEMEYQIEVVSGFSDWVRGAQVIAGDLRAIGVRARLRPSEFSAWFNRMQRGDFNMSVAWGYDGPTPYASYKWLMSSATVKPLGESASGNFHRFGDDRVDELLREFERTVDAAGQRRIMGEIQTRFIELAPAVPLFANPLWSAWHTRRFEGFPTPEDPYAKPSPHASPDCLLVLTRLQPRQP